MWGCRHMKYCLPMIPCSSNKVLIVALTGGLNPLHPRDFYSELMCLVIIYRVIQQVQSWWQSTVWDFLSIRLLLSVHRYLPFEKYNENNCPADRKPFCSRRTNSSWFFLLLFEVKTGKQTWFCLCQIQCGQCFCSPSAKAFLLTPQACISQIRWKIKEGKPTYKDRCAVQRWGLLDNP